MDMQVDALLNATDDKPVILHQDENITMTATPREFTMDLLVDGSDPALLQDILGGTEDAVEAAINMGKYFLATKGFAAGNQYFVHFKVDEDPDTAGEQARKVVAYFNSQPQASVTVSKSRTPRWYRMTLSPSNLYN